ncbi:oligosaccharide flippase family protein [Priestia megaterium]|uniref:lipopolysaccharide biosynthesis protein n=1 Tax=Priestia megaterium TaxID=1404 RepID=UPI003000628C
MRIKFVIRNIFANIGGFFLSTLLNFIVRIVFIRTLGIEYLGINALFMNILTILSIANLGIGTSIMYSFYKPIAENDTKKIQILLSFFAKVYRVIGLVILLLGLSLLPFLDNIIKGENDIPHISIIYILFLLNSVISYFYIHKSSIVTAHQKNYVIVIINNTFTIIFGILQILILLSTKNFILVLLVQLLITITQNIYTSKKAEKMFPYIKQKNSKKIPKSELSDMIENIKGVVLYRIGSVITNGTDNIIISSFLSIGLVGIYSNYLLIINAVTGLFSRIFSSMSASIGNLAASDSKDKQYFIYKVLFLIHFWIYGFASIVLIILINPFIKWWLGAEYVLGNSVVLFIVLNFYLWGMQGVTNNFRVAYGIFKQGKYRPIVASIINLVVSIILVKHMGISGVLIGTGVSILAVAFWFDPLIVHKYGLKVSQAPYFIRYFLYTIVVVVAGVITKIACSFLGNDNLIYIIFKFIICTLIINVIFYLCFNKTKEFQYLWNIRKKYLHSIRGKFSRHKANQSS